jgi:hypothetical protein
VTDNPVAHVVEYTGDRPGRQVWTWCPGCEHLHPFTVEAPPGPGGDRLNSGTTWEWDGNLERPTFSPSLLVHTSVHLCEGLHEVEECTDPDCAATSHALGVRNADGTWTFRNLPGDAPRVRAHVGPHPPPYTNETAWGPCHSFLRNGQWEFLSDCAHRLAGQTVPMVPIPSWWLEGRA